MDGLIQICDEPEELPTAPAPTVDFPKPAFRFVIADEHHQVHQILNGEAHIDNPLESPVREVRVIMRGIQYYIEAESYGEQGPERSKAILFLKESILGNGKSVVILPKGPSTYQFSFDLRGNLPPSWESDLDSGAAIRYWLDAEILYPCGKALRVGFSRVTLIKHIINLTLDPAHAQPKRDMVQKSAWLWSCWSGSISGYLELHRKSAFVPGETVHFRFRIENNSSRVLRKVQVYLTRKIVYYTRSDGPRKLLRIVGLKSWPQEVVAQWENWVSARIKLPANSPQSVEWDGKIEILYSLKLLIKMNGRCPSHLEAKLPVPIGTISTVAAVQEPIPGGAYTYTFVEEPIPEPEADDIAPAPAPPTVAEPKASTSKQANGNGLKKEGKIEQQN